MRIVLTSFIVLFSFFALSQVIEEEKIYVPLEFKDYMSPNKDGKNDSFYIENIELYENSKLVIYNRWGDIVYSTTNYKNDWKGRANVGTAIGKDVTDGVYYYTVQLPDFDLNFKGTITLKR